MRELKLTLPDGNEHRIDLKSALPQTYVGEELAFRHECGGDPEAIMMILAKLSRLIPDTTILIVDQGEEVLTIDLGESGDSWRTDFSIFYQSSHPPGLLLNSLLR